MDSSIKYKRTLKQGGKMKPTRPREKDLPLTDKEKMLLINAPQNAFKALFPNHTRSFLIVEKAKLLKSLPVEKRVISDISIKDSKEELKGLKRKNDYLMNEVKTLTGLLQHKDGLKNVLPTIKIEPSASAGGSEATAVLLLSDWHIDEVVDPATVNYLNSFNYSIAERRIVETFQAAAKMIKIYKRDIEIKEMIVALLGDFISGTIHDDLMEGNSMTTMKAVIKAERLIRSGIQFLLDNTDVKLTLVCCVGNHSRITKKQRIATEKGNALETIIYDHLADWFGKEERVKFVISDGYHVYVDVYAYTLRFHHGHAIKYGGGIGGIFISTYKAIPQWNKGKHADIDCFGHFHQMKDGGNFITNGSIIGYNAYAINIKADYEKPKQAFFLIDKKRGKTITTPIVTNGE
jgi:hypothetical protein